VNSFTQNELASRLGLLDDDMKSQGIPLRFRPLECFKRQYGPIPDGDLRTSLFDSIASWFVDRYGKRATWDQVLGRIPVFIRGELYFVQVPFVSEQTIVTLTDRIDDLPIEVAKSFTNDEFHELAPKVTAATEALQKLYTLHVDDHILDDAQRELAWRAFFDLEHATVSLKETGDTQNAIFHSHAAAEKFMKIALMRAGVGEDPKRLGHDLPKIFKRLVQTQRRFDWLECSVQALQDSAPSMEIRYSGVGRTVQEAVTAYNAALHVCEALAGVWMFDAARGSSEARFVIGRFYIDSGHRTYHCENFPDSDTACLTLFMRAPSRTLFMAETVVKNLYSSFYLEVTLAHEIRTLQERFDFHVRNKGREVTHEEIGLKMASGPEGTYATAVDTVEIESRPSKRRRD